MGFRQDQPLGERIGAGSAQRLGLCLTAALGDCFREVGEDHGEPQPRGDLPREPWVTGRQRQVAQPQQGHEGRHHLGHEDDRVARQSPRVELEDSVACGGEKHCDIERGCLGGSGHLASPHSERLAGEHQELLDDGSQGQSREILEPCHDENHGHQQGDEQHAVGGEASPARGNAGLCGQ